MARKLIKQSLENLLLEMNKISALDLKAMLIEQTATGKSFIELVIEKGLLSYSELVKIMETYFSIKHIELNSIKACDNSLLKYVPEVWAKKYNAVPIDMKDDRIVLAMSDPLDTNAIDEIRFTAGHDIEPVMAPVEEIKGLIGRLYNGSSIPVSCKYFYGVPDFPVGKTQIDPSSNAPAIWLVDSIIEQAVRMKASDIHVEPLEDYGRVRLRVDGRLQEIMRFSKESQPEIISRIKIISNLDITEKRMPKDGRVVINVDGRAVDLRVSVVPTILGEKVVIRLLNRADFLKPKEELGFSMEDLKKIESMIRLPHGIILITGPTGSGKSTTLYALLNELNTIEKNIITIEDPVEYIMEGISQINVNTKIGLTFAAGLRSILRQDPDVIMVGEVRDRETAAIAMSAAITGHLVLSTLHTNDAPSSVDRLIDMGVQPYIVSSALIGVIAQRLIRRICSNCKYQYEADEFEKRLLGISPEENIKLYRGKGCHICNYTGYSSQIAVYEIMEFTEEHKKSIAQNAHGCDIKSISIKNGMRTIMQNCRSLVIKGITTVDELIQKTLTGEVY